MLELITGMHHLAQLQVFFLNFLFFLYNLPKYSLPTLCILPVGPRAGNPLGSHFADKETITGASNILLSWGCILDGLGNNEKRTMGTSASKPAIPTLSKNITVKGKVRHLRETNVASIGLCDLSTREAAESEGSLDHCEIVSQKQTREPQNTKIKSNYNNCQ